MEFEHQFIHYLIVIIHGCVRHRCISVKFLFLQGYPLPVLVYRITEPEPENRVWKKLSRFGIPVTYHLHLHESIQLLRVEHYLHLI